MWPKKRILVVVAALAAAVLAVAVLAGAFGNSDHSQTARSTPSISPPATTGVDYTDPEGQYTITLDPAWTLKPVNAAGKGSGQNEVWLLNADPAAGSTAALGIFARTFTAAETGMSLAAYTKKFIQDNERVGYTVIKQGTLPGTNVSTLGYVEYQSRPTATGNSDTGRRVMAVFDVRNTMVAVAQIGAPPAEFASYRTTALPYLQTLKGSGPATVAPASRTPASP